MSQSWNYTYRLTHQGRNRRVRDPNARWYERRTPSVYLAEPSTRLNAFFTYFGIFIFQKSEQRI